MIAEEDGTYAVAPQDAAVVPVHQQLAVQAKPREESFDLTIGTIQVCACVVRVVCACVFPFRSHGNFPLGLSFVLAAVSLLLRLARPRSPPQRMALSPPGMLYVRANRDIDPFFFASTDTVEFQRFLPPPPHR